MLNYVTVLMLAVVLFAANANSQMVRPASTTPQGHPISVVMTGSDPQQRAEREQMAGRIAERQTQLRLDTEKLVALTNASVPTRDSLLRTDSHAVERTVDEEDRDREER